MSDEDAYAELEDLVRCRCSPAYKDRGIQDPDCDCDSAVAVVLRQLALDWTTVKEQITEAYRARSVAEAKLARAVEALEEAIYLLDPDEEDIAKKAGLYRIVTTYAELKGEDRG